MCGYKDTIRVTEVTHSVTDTFGAVWDSPKCPDCVSVRTCFRGSFVHISLSTGWNSRHCPN